MKLLSVLLALLLLPAAAPSSSRSQAPARTVRGIHTLGDGSSGTTQMHLSWSRHLVGPGGYVIRPFSPVDADTVGPSSEAFEFVEQTYALGLIPIVRLQGKYFNQTGCELSTWKGWAKPLPDEPDSPTSRYQAEAAGYQAFVAGLPRFDGQPLYVQIGNEPNLHENWGGEANPSEYARFLVDVAAALRTLGDPRIVILNAGLAPEGDIDNLSFVQQMVAAEPAVATAFDAWASHPYPRNQPPERNLHDGMALPGSRYTVDAYLLELEALGRSGVDTAGLQVVLTETGYQLGDRWFAEYPTIGEENRAEYTRRAFELWSRWPELRAATPFQLSDPHGTWNRYDWVWPTSESDAHSLPTQSHLAYARLVPGAGVVRGSVRDSRGSPLRGVRLTAGRSGHQAVSVEDGGYTLIAYPGVYELTAEKLGYAPARLEAIRLSADEVVERDLALADRLPATLQNASFETGDLSYWTTWGAVDGVQAGPWYEIEALDQGAFFGTAMNCGEKDGGLFQSVAARPGQKLRLGAWLLTYRDGDAPAGARVGLDPFGGTDPTASSVVWSPWTDTAGGWEHLDLEAVAAAERVTIFLQYDQHGANAWSISAFDAVELIQEE